MPYRHGKGSVLTTAHPHPPLSPLSPPPAPLLEQARQDWQLFLQGTAGEQTVSHLSPELLASILQVWACSRFVARSCIRHPSMLEDLFDSGDLERSYDSGHYAQQLDRALATVTDEATLMTVLRTVRRREMVRIAWRDLAGFAVLDETLADLSALAEACL
ncbi:MAG: hypothetical protein GXP10_10060, partial [Gammaproteobacteria bacterium]|nr:hypothetical protein [Gammaproteobacteria bacterium]